MMNTQLVHTGTGFFTLSVAKIQKSIRQNSENAQHFQQDLCELEEGAWSMALEMRSILVKFV